MGHGALEICKVFLGAPHRIKYVTAEYSSEAASFTQPSTQSTVQVEKGGRKDIYYSLRYAIYL